MMFKKPLVAKMATLAVSAVAAAAANVPWFDCLFPSVTGAFFSGKKSATREIGKRRKIIWKVY